MGRPLPRRCSSSTSGNWRIGSISRRFSPHAVIGEGEDACTMISSNPPQGCISIPSVASPSQSNLSSSLEGDDAPPVAPFGRPLPGIIAPVSKIVRRSLMASGRSAFRTPSPSDSPPKKRTKFNGNQEKNKSIQHSGVSTSSPS